MVWDKKLNTGIMKVDGQHISLLETVELFLDACEDKIAQTKLSAMLDFLGNYAAEHFRDEEELMIESSYPKYKQHKRSHHSFVQNYLWLKGRFESKGQTQKLADDVRTMVLDWVIQHIGGEDAEFAAHYRRVMFK